jgi:hypothetical protein
MVERNTRHEFRNSLHCVTNSKGWGCFEFDPEDRELDRWYQQGYRAAFCFSRRATAWKDSDASRMFAGVKQRYTEQFGEPRGPASDREWNLYVSLADGEEWIVVRNPALITLALLSVDSAERV